MQPENILIVHALHFSALTNVADRSFIFSGYWSCNLDVFKIKQTYRVYPDYLVVPDSVVYLMKHLSSSVEEESSTPAFLCIVSLPPYPDGKIACYVQCHCSNNSIIRNGTGK